VVDVNVYDVALLLPVTSQQCTYTAMKKGTVHTSMINHHTCFGIQFDTFLKENFYDITMALA
jgi:hypothetical protein